MNIRPKVWWFLILKGLPIQAATHMNSEKVLNFVAASSGITRISVESDRIVETYVDPQDAATAIKNTKGHLYVSGQKSIPHMYVSLITKTGQVQDIKLSFKNTPAKPILLKQPQQVTAPNAEPISAEQYLKWLQVFLKGNAPQSFEAKPLSHLEPSRQTDTLVANPKSCWMHPDGYIVTSYIIRVKDSEAPKYIELKAEDFRQSGDLALVCSARTISQPSKSQDVFLYVLKPLSISLPSKGE